MKFYESKSYLLVVNSPKSSLDWYGKTSWEWHYRHEYIEFCKCLYLAAFMQKNHFPIPSVILAPGADPSAKQSASAIKFSMGSDWGKTKIYTPWGYNENDTLLSPSQMSQFCEKHSGEHHFKPKFHIVMDSESKMFSILRKLNGYGPYTTGDAVLFADRNFRSIYDNLRVGNKMERINIKCDEGIIPNTTKLWSFQEDFSETLDKSAFQGMNFGTNLDEPISCEYDENFYQNVLPKLTENRGNIGNEHTIGPRYYNGKTNSGVAKNFFEFVQSFKKEVYRTL